MELALLLLVLVLAELIITVWMLARHKLYLRRLSDMDRTLSKYMATKREQLEVTNGSQDVPEPVADTKSINELVSKATPEDLEQARQVLYALGLGGEVSDGNAD